MHAAARFAELGVGGVRHLLAGVEAALVNAFCDGVLDSTTGGSATSARDSSQRCPFGIVISAVGVGGERWESD